MSQYEHIGSLGIIEVDNEYFDPDHSHLMFQPFTVEEDGKKETYQLYISRGSIDSEHKETYESGDLEVIVKNHQHAQDGVSMWYSLKDPDVIHTWIDKEYLEYNLFKGAISTITPDILK